MESYSPPDMMDTSSSFPRLYMCVCVLGGEGGEDSVILIS